jgi:hypothetical protein
MLVEVLLLNPDALRSGRVIAHLNCCMINPLPAYMMDIVQAARNQQTSRTIMEHNLSNLRHRMANTNRLLVNEMLSDSLGTPADTLVAYLDDLRYLEGRYSLVSYYLGVSDFTNAEAFLDSIDIQIRPKGAKLNELNEMRNYVDFLETLDGQGRNVAQLNPTEIGSLQAIANAKDAGTAGARAKNVLCFFYDICTPPPSSPKSNQVAERKPKPVLENLIKDANMVTISPNPADQFIQFGYQLLFEKEDTEMRVYDQLGRLVKTYAIGLNTSGIEVLDTRKYGQGVYIVEIVQEGKQVFSDKFIVQH